MQDVIADVPGRVFAYRDGALLVIVRGKEASPFGPAYEPVRRELVGRCHTLVVRGPNQDTPGCPEWATDGELSIYKVWEACPAYPHSCAEMAYVAS